MPWAHSDTILKLQACWRNDPSIPNWRKDKMIALTELLQKRAADCRGNLSRVQLYYPEDCNDYDAFRTVTNALDALVIPTSGEGFIARNFGKAKDIE